jgi:dihydrodipicolinate reductase
MALENALYRISTGETTMSEMRLIVAGAGGRMGRTLIKAIAETKGAVLAGAVEAPGAAAMRASLRASAQSALR